MSAVPWTTRAEAAYLPVPSASIVEPPMLRVRAARTDELGVVQEILADASNWETERGLPHPWPVPFPPERLRPALERGEVFLADTPDEPNVATITLQWNDVRIWGERTADAAYVHRLAVRRAFAGRAIVTALLGWAESCARDRGCRWLRLDTLFSSPRLHRYYEAHGFAQVGRVEVGGLDMVLLEKPLAP